MKEHFSIAIDGPGGAGKSSLAKAVAKKLGIPFISSTTTFAIGTVVLPDADLKIYLTASAEERARRRCLELSERGTPEPYEAVLREINERDEQDMHRAIAPLREAADAIRLDTSALNFDESEQALLKLIQEKLQ